MANEWEALGGYYSNDNWKRSLFVGFGGSETYSIGAASLTIGFEIGSRERCKRTFFELFWGRLRQHPGRHFGRSARPDRRWVKSHGCCVPQCDAAIVDFAHPRSPPPPA